MAKGENIFKRKDGRWEARYIKGYELSGKIKYGFCYGKTYREAKEKVTKYKLSLASGKPIISTGTKHRFSFYCDEWLNQKKQKVRESTYIKYETVIEKHIKPKIGSCFPLGITTELIDAFSGELLYTDKLAAKSVHDILVILHSILKYTSSHFPNQFPAIEINYPKENKKEMRVLTLSEQKRFIEYLLEDIDPCKFGVLLALFTGIRIGELCALQWKDVSIHEQSIRIDATMQRIHDIQNSGESKTKIIIGEPKSGNSVRTIPMSDCAAELCRQMKTDNKNAYLLTGSNEFMEPRVLQYRIKKYTKECGLEGVHCHTLRHTFATRAVEVGFDIKSLSEVLGHSSTTITLERYVHSSFDLKRTNMNKLAAVGL